MAGLVFGLEDAAHLELEAVALGHGNEPALTVGEGDQATGGDRYISRSTSSGPWKKGGAKLSLLLPLALNGVDTYSDCEQPR